MFDVISPGYKNRLIEKSDFERTVLSPYLPPVDAAPASLKPFKENGTLVKPYSVYMEKVKRFTCKTPPKILTDLWEEPSKLFHGLVPDIQTYNYRRLTIEEAAFGTHEYFDDVGEICGMELDSATGFGHKPIKKRYEYINREERTIDPLIREIVTRKLSILESGNGLTSIVLNQLKDELRSMDRVRAGKTRVYYVGEITDFLVSKMLFGHFVAWWERHWTQGSCAIGTSPYEMAWSCIYKKAFRFGREAVIGGDISGLDLSTDQYFGYNFAVFLLWATGLGSVEAVFNPSLPVRDRASMTAVFY